jgi:hypothetical protein
VYLLRTLRETRSVFLFGAEIEMARLESENSPLSQKLAARKLLERAKGILQRELKISEEDAYLTLQQESRKPREVREGNCRIHSPQRGDQTHYMMRLSSWRYRTPNECADGCCPPKPRKRGVTAMGGFGVYGVLC